jgi:hypothetical protein
MEPTTKLPAWDEKTIIHKGLLTSKDIKVEGFKVVRIEKPKPDRTLTILNGIIEAVIIIVTSPVILITAIYAGLKWMFTLHYPMSEQAKQLLRTRKYLHKETHSFMTEYWVVLVLGILAAICCTLAFTL